MKAYKLFQTVRSHPGLIFPLFIGKDHATPIGRWVEAKCIPTPGFAVRPGWHVGPKPCAPHLMRKDGSMPPGRVWAEVEIPDNDYTRIAQLTDTKDLREIVPAGGYYRFPRPANQGGEWIIAGAIRVVRILSAEEVKELCQ